MIKALIVDDISENLYLLESLLKGHGYQTVTATNGAEALGLALKDPPDIIITDILMPVMDGYTLCREWKKDEKLKNIPLVFYTATYTHPKDEEFAKSLGADLFLVKPQEPDAFITIIKEVMSQFNGDKINVHVPEDSTELAVFKEYNETLVRKMEDRMLQSQEAEKKIRNYATQLEHEIEQRKLAIEALLESELRFKTLTEVAPVGIFSTDYEGKTNYVNPRWCKIAKLNPESAYGNGWLSAVHPDDRSLLIESWLQAAYSHTSSQAEYRFMHPGGTISWVTGQAVPQKDSNGDIIGYIGTITDITASKLADMEIRLLNEELEQRVSERTAQLLSANMELEAFSYSVSHDLRAPLRAIRSFAAILKEDNVSKFDDESRKNLDNIISSSIHMGQLIEDLLAFSRAGRTEMQVAPIEMNSLVLQVFAELKTSYDPARINFMAENLPPASGDRATIKQVVTNLLSNALKYSSHKDISEILVGSEKKNREITYFIKDNGVGFDMNYLNKLFGVFQRLHSSNEFEGNGVGLAIVKSIITRHGGRVWAEGEVGKGATFFFTLPEKDKRQK